MYEKFAHFVYFWHIPLSAPENTAKMAVCVFWLPKIYRFYVTTWM